MIRKEIGSEFWCSQEMPPCAEIPFLPQNNICFFQSGRGALYAVLADIVKKRACTRAYLPEYCCSSMVDPFVRHGMEVTFYPVHADGGIRTEIDPAHPCDVILTMDYFGYEAAACALPRAIHIHDMTHSVLSRQAYHEADYYFGSLRKWGPVAAAGFAWSRLGTLEAPEPDADESGFALLRNQAYGLKKAYMMGETEEKAAYLKLFNEAEELLDRDYIGYGAEKASLMRARFIGGGKKRRIENAAYLLEALRGSRIVRPVFAELGKADVPLFVPVLVGGGMRGELRAHLIRNEVYCPVHWPVHSGQKNALYENELSLICDQRYDLEAMKRQIQLIQDFEESAGKCK